MRLGFIGWSRACYQWENRPKRPGELILASDGRVDRFYDFQAAVKLARRDRWDSPPYKTGKPGERAARAARADFEFCAAGAMTNGVMWA